VKIWKISFLITVCLTIVFLAGCAAQASDVLVAYTRAGGIANLNDSLTVYRDGRVTVTRRGNQCEFILDRGELKLLEETLATAGLADLDRQYLPENQGADLLEYAVTYNGRTISAQDTAVPDSLWPVLELLNQTAGKCS